MESPSKTCSQCSHILDSDLHIPYSLSKCSHSICSSCVDRHILKSSPLECKIDKTFYEYDELPIKGYDKILPNEGFLVQRSAKDLCKLHNRLLKFKCLDDGENLCIECASCTCHDQHNFVYFDQVVSKVNEKIQTLEGCLQDLSSYYEKLKNLIDDKEKVVMEIVDMKCDFLKTEGKKAEVKELVKGMMEIERKTVEVLLGVSSKVKMEAVRKVVYLRTRVLENLRGPYDERDLDISDYLERVSKEKFEEQYEEVFLRFERKEEYFVKAVAVYQSGLVDTSEVSCEGMVECAFDYLVEDEEEGSSKLSKLFIYLFVIFVLHLLVVLGFAGR